MKGNSEITEKNKEQINNGALTERTTNCPALTSRANSRMRQTELQKQNSLTNTENGDKENANCNNLCQTSRSPLKSLKIPTRQRTVKHTPNPSIGNPENLSLLIEKRSKPMKISPKKYSQFINLISKISYKKLIKSTISQLKKIPAKKSVMKSNKKTEIEKNSELKESPLDTKLRGKAFCGILNGLLNTVIHRRFLKWNYQCAYIKCVNPIKRRMLGRALAIVLKNEILEKSKNCFAYWRVKTIFSSAK